MIDNVWTAVEASVC